MKKLQNEISEILTRGIVNIIPDKKSLEQKLLSGNALNIYLGIDPTATKIHLGHAVSLRKIAKFAELGHNVTFLIGDFTALIGDTSDKNSERPVLTYEEIQKNFSTYKEQAEKILDFNKIKVVNNSSWLKNLKFEDIIKLSQQFSLGDFIGRELIKERIKNNGKIGLHEVLYPVMQGYDSYHLDTDIQVGAADQTFNMQAGRTLLKNLSNKDSFVLVTDYLSGTDGRKMSKSWGNAIWLDDTEDEIYGKVMSLSDDQIINYFTLATNTPIEEIENHQKDLNEGKNPRDVKSILAQKIVSEIYDNDKAERAKKNFENKFQKGSFENVETIYLSEQNYNLSDLLIASNFISSKTEAKRLIKDDAIEINEEIINDHNKIINIEKEILLKVGKKKFAKIVQKKNE